MRPAAIAAFADALGYDQLLAKGGLLESDCQTITDSGREALARHGLKTPRRAQEERVGVAAVLAALAGGPARLHELPVGLSQTCKILRRLRSEGVVSRLEDGRFALANGKPPTGSKPIDSKALEAAGLVHDGNVTQLGREVLVLNCLTSTTKPSRQRRKKESTPIKGQRITLDLASILRPGDHTDDSRWAILVGDALKRLRELPEDCVDIVVTSPPYYKLRDYGEGQMGDEDTPDLYVEGQVAILEELGRVLSPRGLIFYVIEDKREKKSGRLFGVIHDIVSRVKKTLFLKEDVVWEKEGGLADTSGRSLTIANEHVLVFAKSEDFYWNELLARELGSRGVTKNATTVVHFSRRKEPWQKGHDAVFSVELVQWALRLGASFHGRCSCGEPWEYVVSKEERGDEHRKHRRSVTKTATRAAPRCGHDTPPEPILILDPFCGSGTTGMVGLRHGLTRFVGIERQQEWVEGSSKNLGTISPEKERRNS